LDAVQEAWLRLSHVDTDTIENLGGWLTTVDDGRQMRTRGRQRRYDPAQEGRGKRDRRGEQAGHARPGSSSCRSISSVRVESCSHEWRRQRQPAAGDLTIVLVDWTRAA
jgi:hypothetical protein